MEELHKPHDRFFRAVFTQEDNARDLLLSTLPERILEGLNLQSINVENASVIDSRLSEYQSDILIRTSLRGSPALIYVLIEHKSSPDRWTLLQLLKYMVRIWERERSRRGKKITLPPIIPVIFYHGTRKWRVPRNFSSYFVSEVGREPYIPEFQPVFVDLQRMADGAVQGSLMVQMALKTLKHSLGNLRPYLVEILGSLSRLPLDEKHRAFLSILLEYIIEGSKDINDQDVQEAFQSIGSREVREEYMTLAEKLIEKGKTEGKREAREEYKTLAEKLIEKGKAEGKREGAREGKREARAEYMTLLEKLIEKGKREGELEGKLLDKQEVLLQLLTQKFGAVADGDKKKIIASRDLETLDQAIALILNAQTVAEVLQPLS